MFQLISLRHLSGCYSLFEGFRKFLHVFRSLIGIIIECSVDEHHILEIRRIQLTDDRTVEIEYGDSVFHRDKMLGFFIRDIFHISLYGRDDR